MASVQVYLTIKVMSAHHVLQECDRPVLDLHQHWSPHRTDGCPVRGAGQWTGHGPALR